VAKASAAASGGGAVATAYKKGRLTGGHAAATVTITGGGGPGANQKGQAAAPAPAPARPVKTSCRDCGTTSTPQWRCGPTGPRSLCNACGVRYKKGLAVGGWPARPKGRGGGGGKAGGAALEEVAVAVGGRHHHHHHHPKN
jgi:hypothetical protein